MYEKKQTMKRNLNWAKGKPEYENIFNDWKKAYDQYQPYARHSMYINEGIFGSPCSPMLHR